MNIKEIVYCYVDKTISMPKDMSALRESFKSNGFLEKELKDGRWLYKRGAAFALEFNYNSDTIQMQVILEKVGDQLKVSVGNWGFPFEPLMMKKRFQQDLEEITNQISSSGKLENQPEKSKNINASAKTKNRLAIAIIALSFLSSLAYELLTAT